MQLNDEVLLLDLDKNIQNENWDIIIVDAPLGHQPPRNGADQVGCLLYLL